MALSRQQRIGLAAAVSALVVVALLLGRGHCRGTEDTAGDASVGARAAENPKDAPARPTLAPREGPGSELLSGQVVDARGTPVAGVAISAQLELGPGVSGSAPVDAGPGLELEPEVVAVSDDQGRFALRGLSAGRHRLRVEGEGILTAELRFVEAPQSDVQLLVSREVDIVGMVRESDRPTASVPVHCQREGQGAVISTVTDSQGRFRFGELAEGQYLLWSAHGQRAARALPVERLGAGPFPEVELLLEAAHLVSGRVVEAGTTMGVAAEVVVRDTMGIEPARVAVSGVDGSFVVEGVLAGRWHASASAPGYLPGESQTFAAESGASPRLSVSRGAVVSGRVLDAQGAPLAGAIVLVSGLDDGGGEREYSLYQSVPLTELPGALAAGQSLLPRGELGVLTGPIPYPPPPGSGTLRVTRPVAVAAPTPLANSSQALSQTWAPRFSTESDGEYRITGVVSGRYRLVASHPDYADQVTSEIAVRSGQLRLGIDVRLRRGTRVRGKILDEGGLPLAGAAVYAHFDDKRRSSVAVTGPDGSFELAPIAGRVRVSVEAIGREKVERELLLEGDGDERAEEFRLAAADARLEGRVVDESGFPVRGARVELEASSSVLAARTATTDADGRFTIASLPRGSYGLRLHHPEYPPARAQMTTGRSAEVHMSFGGGIELALRDGHTKSALAGILIEAEGPAASTHKSVTDAQGRATLVPLVPGTWTLRVSQSGYRALAETIEVTAGSAPRAVTVRDRVLELLQGARVSGVVRNSQGDRVAGARVHIGSVSTVADDDGEFRLADVPTGSVRIEADKKGLRGTTQLRLEVGDERLGVEVRLGEEGAMPEVESSGELESEAGDE